MAYKCKYVSSSLSVALAYDTLACSNCSATLCSGGFPPDINKDLFPLDGGSSEMVLMPKTVTKLKGPEWY